jgi:hypothetical protein
MKLQVWVVEVYLSMTAGRPRWGLTSVAMSYTEARRELERLTALGYRCRLAEISPATAPSP